MPDKLNERDVIDVFANARRPGVQASTSSFSSDLSVEPSNTSGSRKQGTLGRLKSLGRNLRKTRLTADPTANYNPATAGGGSLVNGPLRSKWAREGGATSSQLVSATSNANELSFTTDGKASGKAGAKGNASSNNRKNGEMLAQIARDTNDLESEMGRLNEKGIVSKRADLTALEQDCTLELQSSVIANYRAYITASQSMRQLEGETQQLREHLSSFPDVVANLKAIAAARPFRMAEEATEKLAAFDTAPDWRDSVDGRRWATKLADIDVAIAERRGLDALQALQLLCNDTSPDIIAMGFDAKEQLESRRQKLVADMEVAVGEPSSSAADTRLALGVLAGVTGQPGAMRVLLLMHSARLSCAQQQLLKPQKDGENDGTECTLLMAQELCYAVAAAADDTAAVFGEDVPNLTALFIVWALNETDRAALLLKRHALTPYAVPAGLTATVKCALLIRAQALALQASHGISLAGRLTKQLWAPVEEVLLRRLRCASENARRSLNTEADRIAKQGMVQGGEKPVWGRLMDNWQSADDLLNEVNFCVKNLVPLGGPRVAAALRKGIVELYGSYTSAMAAAFTRHKGSEGRFPPLLDAAVNDAMETVKLLHEKFLPEAVAALEYLGPICAPAALLPHTKALAEFLGCSLQ